MEGNNQSVKELKKKIDRIKKIWLWITNLNVLIVGMFVIFFILLLGLLGGGAKNSASNSASNSGNLNLSSEVLQWKGAVISEAEEQGVPELVPYILAIIQIESGGRGTDIMQSSESTGGAVGSITDPLKSIEQGVRHLKNAVVIAEASGITDFLAIVQSYNFGTSYVTYLAHNNKSHNVGIAEEYSKTVVAPSLGNHTGMTYGYSNAISQSYGKTYLYSNGGNFYYADMVKQYLGGSGSGLETNPSDFYEDMRVEMEKYEGWSYAWGGKNPISGFDCSGLTAYLYQVTAGISIDSYTVTQWDQSVPVELSEAKAGDLIFFKGTYGPADFISHVGIYVNETTMFDSNSSGIGYHFWNDAYWMNHFAGIRRVIQ